MKFGSGKLFMQTLAFVALCTIGLETRVVGAFLSEFFVPVGNFGSPLTPAH